MTSIQYPKPERLDVKDELHGVTVEDPYRWMEDPDSAQTKAFVEAQNLISKKLLEECPHREDIRKKLTDLWDFPKYSAPSKKGNFYFFRKNDGLQNQYVLYRKEGLDGTPEVFLDPNLFSEDGTTALTASTFSENGTYFCYGLAAKGSDWSTLHVKDVRTKTDLPDKIERFRYSSISWTKDEKGFFYGQYSNWSGKQSGSDTATVMSQKVFYHRLNTTQDKDVLCVEFSENPNWRMFPRVSECGKYLMVIVMEGCKDKNVYLADISAGIEGKLALKAIYERFDCEINYITNDDTVFYFHTNKDRPNYGVIKLDINEPTKWTDVVPMHDKNVLEWAWCVGGDKLVVAYMKDVCNVVVVFHLQSGKFLQVLPFEIGTISGMTGDRKSSEAFFSFTSFLTPATIYRVDLSSAPHAQLEEYQRIKLIGCPTDNLMSKQVFYKSKDNTDIPMFIMQKKNAPIDGSSPCLLYIYGGFNVSVQPTFSAFKLMLVKFFGFRVAVANVRGGGEYGERWHNAGRLRNKQNTMDDVQAAAKYLADNGYTKSSRIVLMGGSNGGMVTLASINQRPELFGAAVAKVPVTDMFRFHKFTVGGAWCSDYGDPDEPEDFVVLARYSPLHNIPTGIDYYPSLLITTADHDDRVVPAHSLKFLAELQYRLGERNKKPLLALIDTRDSPVTKPTSKIIEDFVEIVCFLYRELELEYED